MVKRWTVDLSHFLRCAEGPSCEAEGIPGKIFPLWKQNKTLPVPVNRRQWNKFSKTILQRAMNRWLLLSARSTQKPMKRMAMNAPCHVKKMKAMGATCYAKMLKAMGATRHAKMLKAMGATRYATAMKMLKAMSRTRYSKMYFRTRSWMST